MPCLTFATNCCRIDRTSLLYLITNKYRNQTMLLKSITNRKTAGILEHLLQGKLVTLFHLQVSYFVARRHILKVSINTVCTTVASWGLLALLILISNCFHTFNFVWGTCHFAVLVTGLLIRWFLLLILLLDCATVD